jgi:hypothetical protein
MGARGVSMPTYGRKFFRRPKRIRNAKAIRKIARQEINRDLEVHYVDTAQATITADSAGVISTQLSTIAQGNNDSNRTGDNVKIKSIQIKGTCVTADATNVMRIVLFQWLQNSGSVAPTALDVLQNTGQPYSPYSPYTKDVAGYNMIPLADRMLTMNTLSDVNKPFTIKVSGKKLRKGNALDNIQFTAGGTSGIGHYYLLFLSDSGALSHPTFSYYCRIRFTG